MYNNFERERLNKTEVNKFVLCEARDDNATRLFIHKFNKFSSSLTKDGWWDTFAISIQPCKKGFYLCNIMKFKLDKNDYLNMIVKPSKFLGENIDEDSAAWEYLFYSGKFSKEYKGSQRRERFNTTNLYKLYNKSLEESEYDSIEIFIFDSFIIGYITLDDIANALNEKYEIEKLAEDINKNIEKYSEEYPLLIKKLPKEESPFGTLVYTTTCTIDFLNDNSYKYDQLKLGDEENILNRVEEVMKYWNNIHNAQKEERKKAKKLAKKQKQI
jgi:hypothetical protein